VCPNRANGRKTKKGKRLAGKGGDLRNRTQKRKGGELGTGGQGGKKCKREGHLGAVSLPPLDYISYG